MDFPNWTHAMFYTFGEGSIRQAACQYFPDLARFNPSECAGKETKTERCSNVVLEIAHRNPETQPLVAAALETHSCGFATFAPGCDYTIMTDMRFGQNDQYASFGRGMVNNSL